ncbi:hypothetical protein K7640_16900 [Micromonospora sp. PLK6-60]|uniref:DUF7144 family membrane protein n=1 Tax=Micromonospora sp. PLK6-60 TaxID=2873383 RepID=UPI001CA70734|nr:hypothetical protein [Micromonospora sp. PLK6-60]MBY8873516.1 hypothetical protein [Micromonospora sp. PLK6-60]
MTGYEGAELRKRRRRLAGLLLAGAGLFDALAAVGDVHGDPYVVVTQEGVFHVDVTGWVWAHLVAAVLMLTAGLLLFTGWAWAIRLAAVVAVADIAVHLIVLPYQPFWSLMVVGLAVGALRLLWHCRSRAAPDEVTPVGRPAP